MGVWPVFYHVDAPVDAGCKLFKPLWVSNLAWVQKVLILLITGLFPLYMQFTRELLIAFEPT